MTAQPPPPPPPLMPNREPNRDIKNNMLCSCHETPYCPSQLGCRLQLKYMLCLH